MSVIDTRRGKVVQTIATQPWPEASVGYEPDAVTLTDDGHLLVTLGRANAVAVYRYTSPQEPVGYVGLLPTDYFPAEIATVGGQVVVSNTRGIDARRPTTSAGHNTHDTTSSLQHFTLPSDRVIRSETAKVFEQNGWSSRDVKLAKGKQKSKAVPVPARIGDPSTIKHVFLIVKENRTYDQVFGDIPQGNGDTGAGRVRRERDAEPARAGRAVRPVRQHLRHRHQLRRGPQLADAGRRPGVHRVLRGRVPAQLRHRGRRPRPPESGFLWTGAQAAGKTVRDFGEFQQFLTKPAAATWQNLYCDARTMDATGQGTAYPLDSSSPIPSLNSVSVPGFPKFDTSIPDLYRYEIWKQDFEKNGPANLNMFWLSSDHTGGPANAAAQVADNDLAVGRMVDTITHSAYWKDSAIFVVEDDSQAGLDHVDGHRAPIQIISPYAQHGVVDDHYYSQITMIRTIEQILGIHPMNQKDSAASPMAAAFTRKPDYTPFTALPNRTSLTAGLSTPPSCGVDTPAPQDPHAAAVPTTTAVPAAEAGVAAQWNTWKSHQRLTGPNAVPDFANPAQMNHFTWYQTHDWTKPYPGESKIYAPNDVPGAYLPSSETDG